MAQDADIGVDLTAIEIDERSTALRTKVVGFPVDDAPEGFVGREDSEIDDAFDDGSIGTGTEEWNFHLDQFTGGGQPEGQAGAGEEFPFPLGAVGLRRSGQGGEEFLLPEIGRLRPGNGLDHFVPPSAVEDARVGGGALCCAFVALVAEGRFGIECSMLGESMRGKATGNVFGASGGVVKTSERDFGQGGWDRVDRSQ